MKRSITVKGIGKVRVKPDLIIITFNLKSQRYEYDGTMQLANETVAILEGIVEASGFSKKDLKTTNFNVNTFFKSYQDTEGNYQKTFVGYRCIQDLRLEFNLDLKLMTSLLTSIGESSIDPNFNILFSVKDTNAVSEELLINATENARKKAEILARSSNITLKELISIDYNLNELQLYSSTNYQFEESKMLKTSAISPKVEPDDIEVSDVVTFVWQI